MAMLMDGTAASEVEGVPEGLQGPLQTDQTLNDTSYNLQGTQDEDLGKHNLR
jgi:hypothetical protein